MAAKTKEGRIKVEKRRLNKIFEGMDEVTLALMEGAINSAAYNRVMIEDLQAFLLENGQTEMFQQSDRVKPYARLRPEAQQYNSLLGCYQRTLKMLAAHLPDDASKDSAAELMEFLNK